MVSLCRWRECVCAVSRVVFTGAGVRCEVGWVASPVVCRVSGAVRVLEVPAMHAVCHSTPPQRLLASCRSALQLPLRRRRQRHGRLPVQPGAGVLGARPRCRRSSRPQARSAPSRRPHEPYAPEQSAGISDCQLAVERLEHLATSLRRGGTNRHNRRCSTPRDLPPSRAHAACPPWASRVLYWAFTSPTCTC